MGIFRESKEEAHERGQQDGSKAGFWETTVEQLSNQGGEALGSNTPEDDAYHQGFQNGLDNPAKSK